MAEQTTIMYFSDGTTETMVASVRRLEQLTAKSVEGFVPLTTVDGRRLNVNLAHVTRFSEHLQSEDDPPASSEEDPLQVTGVRQAVIDSARSISAAISARKRRQSQGAYKR